MKRLFLFVQLSLLSAALGLTACQSDGADSSLRQAGDPVAFGARMRQADLVRSRTTDLDSVYINSELYDIDFYIQLCCGGFTDVGTYVIPSGYEGQLKSKEQDLALNWHDIAAPHTFYAWTIPWDPDWTPEDPLKPVHVEFHDSPEANGFETHRNNEILEKFIGAKSETYSYKEHGKYVDLTFRHLVSKIRIGSLMLIETDGSIRKDLKADVTFIGMPTAADFYPHPDDDGRPRIEKSTWVTSKDSGVTYFIDNNATTEDIFYICPEVDFSEIDFKVKLNSIDYVTKDIYYGTFDDVEFIRKPGSAYDSEDGGDEKILHAGEMMTLNIVLIPGIGPGLSIVISDWSVDKPRESQYHTYPGIYSDAEVRELLDAFLNQKLPGQGGTTQEELERLFDMYGKTGEDGKKYFPLFENVDISNSSSGNIFPIPSDYILDGMGHTITLKSNRGNNPDFNSYDYYFNIGQVVDVYLTDGNGHSIYIDKNGYVYTYNAETNEYTNTGHQLEPLEDPYKSYDISCETGIVHKSTYYNNNIVGS